MEPIQQPGEVGRLPFPERLRVLLVAAAELTGPHELDEVLLCIVEGAATVAGARYAALGVYDDDGQITTFINRGFDAATIARIAHPPVGRGLLGQIILADRPIRLANIGIDPRSCGFPPNHPPMSRFLGVPIVRRGHRYGNLYVTERRDGEGFDDDDEAMVVAFAAFAAGALESAELVEADRARAEARVARVAAEEQARARSELLAKTIAAQEAERARVSRDLHDDVGQALTSVLLGLRLVEQSLEEPGVDLDDARLRSAELRELVADALRRARRLAFDLRPTVLDDLGLAPALERLTADVAERTGLSVELDVGLGADERLAPATETVVYRIVQEALTNVVRHARASQVSVTLAGLGGRVRALVEDDGAGFTTVAGRPGGHLGLAGMDERARLVDGSVEVTSAPGKGTTVVLEVPRG